MNEYASNRASRADRKDFIGVLAILYVLFSGWTFITTGVTSRESVGYMAFWHEPVLVLVDLFRWVEGLF